MLIRASFVRRASRFAVVMTLVGAIASTATAQDEPTAESTKPAAEPVKKPNKPSTDAGVPPLAVPPLPDQPDANASAGSEDLAKAIELKLAAEVVGDLDEVVMLCRRALAKGLGDEDVVFAKKMLASALLQRAAATCQPLFNTNRNDPQWQAKAIEWRKVALDDLQASLTYDNRVPEAHYLLARLHAITGGDLSRAATALNDALKLEPEDPDLHARILALRAAVVGDGASRLADLDKALELSPQNPEILRTRGLMYVQLGRPQDAMADLDRVVLLVPDQAGSYESRAMALMAAKDHDKALVDLNKAIELAPESPVPRLQRARLFLLRGEATPAIADLDAILDKSPEYEGALLIRSTAHKLAGHEAEAADDLEKVALTGGRSGSRLQKRAAVWTGLERFDEAAADLEAALESEPKNGALMMQIAELRLQQKQFTRAIELYNLTLELGGKNWMVRQRRGDALLAIGRQAEAIADYKDVLQAEGSNPGTLNNLAWVLATSPDDKLRDGEQAVELARRVCEITGYSKGFMLSTLAAAYAESGDFEQAKEWSQKALDAESDEKVRANLQKELQSYEAGKPWRELQDQEQAGLTAPIPPPGDNATDAKPE